MGDMETPAKNSRRQMLETATTIAVLIGSLALAATLIQRWFNKGDADTPLPEPQKIDRADTKGDTGARVGIMMFSDFECPFCAAFAVRTLPTIEKRYIATGKVLLAFRHFPLPTHAFGWAAAQAAECAARQGRFWQMHDRLFASPRQFERENLVQHGRALGLASSFAECLDGEAVDAVNDDISAGTAVGAAATPLFLIGPLLDGQRIQVSRKIVGAPTVADLSDAIEAILKRR